MSTTFSGRITTVMARILAALEERGDMTAHDLAEAACTCVNSLSGGGYLRRMRALGMIRVASWQRNAPGAPTPVYSLSPGADAKPPRPYTNSQRTKRWKIKTGYKSSSWETARALERLAGVRK